MTPNVFIKKLVLPLLLCLSCSSQVWAKSALISDYSADYKVKWHGIPVGTSHHQFSIQKNGQYMMVINSKTTVPLVNYKMFEQSSGRWRGEKLVPETYRYDFKSPTKAQNILIKFDWDAMLFSSNIPNVGAKPLKPNTLDRVSHQLMLRYQIKQKLKSDYHFSVLEKKRIKDYIYSFAGRHVIKTSVGNFSTVQYYRETKKRRTDIWYAVDLDYLPVKVIHQKNNKVVGTAEIYRYKL